MANKRGHSSSGSGMSNSSKNKNKKSKKKSMPGGPRSKGNKNRGGGVKYENKGNPIGMTVSQAKKLYRRSLAEGHSLEYAMRWNPAETVSFYDLIDDEKEEAVKETPKSIPSIGPIANSVKISSTRDASKDRNMGPIPLPRTQKFDPAVHHRDGGYRDIRIEPSSGADWLSEFYDQYNIGSRSGNLDQEARDYWTKAAEAQGIDAVKRIIFNTAKAEGTLGGAFGNPEWGMIKDTWTDPDGRKHYSFENTDKQIVQRPPVKPPSPHGAGLGTIRGWLDFYDKKNQSRLQREYQNQIAEGKFKEDKDEYIRQRPRDLPLTSKRKGKIDPRFASRVQGSRDLRRDLLPISAALTSGALNI